MYPQEFLLQLFHQNIKIICSQCFCLFVFFVNIKYTFPSSTPLPILYLFSGQMVLVTHSYNLHISFIVHVDIDECKTDNGGCEQNCTNTQGSYQCGCFAGYIMSNVQKNCSGKVLIRLVLPILRQDNMNNC